MICLTFQGIANIILLIFLRTNALFVRIFAVICDVTSFKHLLASNATYIMCAVFIDNYKKYQTMLEKLYIISQHINAFWVIFLVVIDRNLNINKSYLFIKKR